MELEGHVGCACSWPQGQVQLGGGTPIRRCGWDRAPEGPGRACWGTGTESRVSGRRGPGQGLRGTGEPVCTLSCWLSRPHARGWAAARALPLGQEDAAWQGQGPAITSDAARRDPWRDQGEAIRPITKPGTQVGPGPPAGSRRSRGWAKAPLSPGFWFCSVRIFLPLRCNAVETT